MSHHALALTPSARATVLLVTAMLGGAMTAAAATATVPLATPAVPPGQEAAQVPGRSPGGVADWAPTAGAAPVGEVAPERAGPIPDLPAEAGGLPRRLMVHLRHRDAYQGAGRRTLGETERSERVQTIEGRPAFIRAGRSVPVPTWQSYGGGALPFVEQRFDYRDAAPGFFVTPRLVGDEVLLDIAQEVVQPGHGNPPPFVLQQAATTLRVRPGHWVTLGGAGGSPSRRLGGTPGPYATRRAGDTIVEVMVEVLPEP